MRTYLKNMEGYKHQDLKLKGFDSIQEMFDRAFKRVNTFEDFRTELVEGKEKRAGTELIQENAKKQKWKMIKKKQSLNSVWKSFQMKKRKSTSGSMQLLGDRLVRWSSKKQNSTAISNTTAEYIALSGCLENGVVELYFVRTEYQLVDIFTKPLAREQLEFLIKKLGMQIMSPETLKKLADEEAE
ncbi:hypothetical protein Tco_0952772 [Tanacetum coccineum]|uniref:Uncharacterized protein n=1 Tax=Tanacetum coccineum TaxID=301880 RepID=A0ABQ5E0A1_9ASTR